MRIDFDRIRHNIEENKYPIIGVGSARIVYDAQNGYVVKAARNKRGIAQNKAEKQIEAQDHNHIFARVLAVSDDFAYLIMEKAERINSLQEVWEYYKVRSNHELFQLEEFRNLTARYNLLYADLYRKNSWGMVNQKPVIIDFGFTRETRKYYRNFFRFHYQS